MKKSKQGMPSGKTCQDESYATAQFSAAHVSLLEYYAQKLGKHLILTKKEKLTKDELNDDSKSGKSRTEWLKEHLQS